MTCVDTIHAKLYGVPDKNPHFVGRVELLAEIVEKLSKETPSAYNHRVALFGMGGIGKTQTALAFVHSQLYCYKSIFWMSAADERALLSDFYTIAQQVDEIKDISTSQSKETAHRVLCGYNNRRIDFLCLTILKTCRLYKVICPR